MILIHTQQSWFAVWFIKCASQTLLLVWEVGVQTPRFHLISPFSFQTVVWWEQSTPAPVFTMRDTETPRYFTRFLRRCHISMKRTGPYKKVQIWWQIFVNDTYGFLLKRCCTSTLNSYEYQILHHGCALKRKKWTYQTFLPFKDFKCVFRYQRSPTLVILSQHFNRNCNWIH